MFFESDVDSIGIDVFDNCAADLIIWIPSDALTLYAAFTSAPDDNYTINVYMPASEFLYEDITINGIEGKNITGYIYDETGIVDAYALVIPKYIERKPVLMIDDGVFSGRSLIASVKIPDTLIIIGERSFEECINLESVILSKALKA